MNGRGARARSRVALRSPPASSMGEWACPVRCRASWSSATAARGSPLSRRRSRRAPAAQSASSAAAAIAANATPASSSQPAGPRRPDPLGSSLDGGGERARRRCMRASSQQRRLRDRGGRQARFRGRRRRVERDPADARRRRLQPTSAHRAPLIFHAPRSRVDTRAGSKPDSDARRDPVHPQHQRHRPGELLAVAAPLVVEQERLQRIAQRGGLVRRRRSWRAGYRRIRSTTS